MKQSECSETSQKLSFKLNHFLTFQIRNKWFLSYRDHDPDKRNCSYAKVLGKLEARIQKVYQISFIFCNPLSFRYQLISTKRNSWFAVNLQRPFIYSNNTSTLLLSLGLYYKSLGILQTVTKNKSMYIQY